MSNMEENDRIVTLTDEDGNEILEPIESDEEYERIADLFIERLDAEFDDEEDSDNA
jgi:uncharacterized protein YrzB (UPF0473 family)